MVNLKSLKFTDYFSAAWKPLRKSDTSLVNRILNILLTFILSALVTAFFSASLYKFFSQETFSEVLNNGMYIPALTWTLQLIASGILMKGNHRLDYWAQLGTVCLIGSLALIPAGIYNFIVQNPNYIFSVINVLLSVVLMAWEMLRRTKKLGYSTGWAISFVIMIIINMRIYAWTITH